MVNTNKILTVSYGTFSCTLEGFDDSFDMMKDIAEYFRDLAADDRFFGAEPPTPDAEMLARIAEHTAARRVEAREESGSIVLRPTVTPEQAAPAETAEPAVAAPVSAQDPEPVEPLPEPDDAPQQAEEIQPEEAMEDAVVEEDTSDVIEPPAPAPKLDEESVAAKLSRIRAVVNRNAGADDVPSAAYSEDEHADDAEIAAESSVEEAAELETEAEAASASDNIDAVLRETQSVADEYEPIEEAAEPASATQIEDPQLAADVAEAASDVAPEQQDTVEKPARPARPARVVRMKREAFDAAVAEGQIEAEAPKAAGGLSADEEQDLLRELAEVEAELNLTRLSDAPDEEPEADEEPMKSIFADEEAPDPVAQPAATAPAEPSGKGDTDVSRLMDKAAEEMDRPEGAHRRSAIAHLRAAVEATRAETEAGGGMGRNDDSLDAYRDDLNSVVRPRRPRAEDGQSDAGRRPVKKPAPLKLVAEQRVDTEEAAKPRVVRPRRVSVEEEAPKVAENKPEDAGSFAEFADKAGVKDLAELMEAAAAYMSYVEGRQKFSRPQLMNKARQVEEYRFTREDGLRSFGQLLRDGKIEKLKGGRFTVSDELIGFKPSARAVG